MVEIEFVLMLDLGCDSTQKTPMKNRYVIDKYDANSHSSFHFQYPGAGDLVDPEQLVAIIDASFPMRDESSINLAPSRSEMIGSGLSRLIHINVDFQKPGATPPLAFVL